jgi:hypothetical protein
MTLLAYLNQYILELPRYAALVVLLGTFVLQLVRRDAVRRHTSRVFLYASGFFAAYLLYVGFLQFLAFQSGILGGLLGQGETFRWFLGYVRINFWNEYIVSFALAILFILVAGYANRKTNERFFESEERYLGALGIFIVGYPGCLFYIVAMLLVPAAVSLYFIRRGERLPLYYFWMPVAAALVAVIHFWAGHQAWWSLYKF